MNAQPSLFLDASEVEALTGFKAQHRQVDWLQYKGWRFVTNAAGRPIVARKYTEKMLGCGSDDGAAPALSPNFGAIVRAV